MDLRFYIDPETDDLHIHLHGVEVEEVYEAMESGMETVRGRNNTKILTGQTYAGRYLRVIYSLDINPDGYFIITAYELVGKALRAFKARRRKSK